MLTAKTLREAQVRLDDLRDAPDFRNTGKIATHGKYGGGLFIGEDQIYFAYGVEWRPYLMATDPKHGIKCTFYDPCGNPFFE